MWCLYKECTEHKELQCDLQCQLVVHGSEQISTICNEWFAMGWISLTGVRVNSGCWWAMECIDGRGSACLSIRFISLTLIGVQLKHPQLLLY